MGDADDAGDEPVLEFTLIIVDVYSAAPLVLESFDAVVAEEAVCILEGLRAVNFFMFFLCSFATLGQL